MRILKKSIAIPIINEISLLVAESGVPGPTVWITAAIHGDEVTGTAIIHALFAQFESNPLLRGKIYAVPVLNPSGFEASTRNETHTNTDLNRQFDDTEAETPAHTIASSIRRAIVATKPDFLIDIHTESANAIPFTLVDFPKELTDLEVLKKSITIAQTLNFPWVIDSENTAGYSIKKCLTGRLALENIPGVVVEIGWPKVAQAEYVESGLSAIIQFLQSQSMFEKKYEIPKIDFTNIPTLQEPITVQQTGIIEFLVKPGKQIKKGDLLAIVRDVFGGTIETITSPFDGLLLSHEDITIAQQGVKLFNITKATYGLQPS